MKKTIVILLIVIGAAAFAGILYLRHGHVYEISEKEIQTRIETQFPVEKCVLVFCIELDQPFVRLTEGQTRVEFGSKALMEVAFSNDQYEGSAEYSGELMYRPEQIAFYLENSRLENLEVNGVSDKHKENLNQLASLLVSEYLRTNPLYTFKGTALELVAPWLELKEVSVREGVLRLKLGLAS